MDIERYYGARVELMNTLGRVVNKGGKLGGALVSSIDIEGLGLDPERLDEGLNEGGIVAGVSYNGDEGIHITFSADEEQSGNTIFWVMMSLGQARIFTAALTSMIDMGQASAEADALDATEAKRWAESKGP